MLNVFKHTRRTSCAPVCFKEVSEDVILQIISSKCIYANPDVRFRDSALTEKSAKFTLFYYYRHSNYICLTNCRVLSLIVVVKRLVNKLSARCSVKLSLPFSSGFCFIIVTAIIMLR